MKTGFTNAHRLLVLLAFLGSVSGCTHATSSAVDVADGQLVLAMGTSAHVTPSMVVELLDVQDSRCPASVTCITAGDVVMVLAFSGAGSARTDTLRLNALPKTSTYGGIVFQPTAVSPYPDIHAPPASAMVTLRVSLAPNL